MRSLALRIASVIAVCTVIAGCNRNTPPAQPQPAPASAPVAVPAAPAPVPQPPPIPPGTEQPVSSIDSVMLNRPQTRRPR